MAADLGSAVISVEPHPEALRALEEGAALNGYTFETIPAALSAEAGVMHLTRGLGSMNHLLPKGDTGGDAVEVRTLDEVLGDRLANGTKIDVEGAERLVLYGPAVAIAERRLPVIQLEWNRTSRRNFCEDRDVVADLLVASGYEFFRPNDHGHLEPTEVGTFGSDVFAVLKPQAAPVSDTSR